MLTTKLRVFESDPYNIRDNQQLKEDRGYAKCSYKYCDVCKNFVDVTPYVVCNATARKHKIRRELNAGIKVLVQLHLENHLYWITKATLQRNSLHVK